MRVTILVSAVVIVLLAMLGLQKNRVPVSTDATVRASTDNGQAPAITPATRPAPSVKGPPALPEGLTAITDSPEAIEKLPQGAVILTDPAVLAAIRDRREQRELRLLEASPAKDTPEMKAVESLLTKRGLGRAAAGPCYNFTWNYHHMLRMTENPTIAMAAVKQQRARFPGDAELDDDFWMALVAIQPKVFFGISQ